MNFSGKQILDKEHGAKALFLCGFPSSGTDLLKNLINANRNIHIGGEFPLLPSLATKYRSIVPSQLIRQAVEDLRRIDFYHSLGNAESDAFSRQKDMPFSEIFARLLTSNDARWIGNKTPQNAENILALDQLFPEAKFIIIIRDVRDVALSWERKWGKDPFLCSAKWNRRMLYCMEQTKLLKPDRYMLIKYENLLQDIEPIARQICNFLDIEFDKNMLAYHKHTNSIIDGKLNYGRPLIKDNFGKWRYTLKTSTILRIEEIAYEGMSFFEYKPVEAKQFVGLSKKELLFGTIRDAWAIIFVGNRAVRRKKLIYRVRSIYLEILKRIFY